MNVLALSVLLSIASLKVALTLPVMGTSLAPLRGVLDVIVGAVGGGVVETPLLEPPHATIENISSKPTVGLKRFDFEFFNIIAPWL